MQEKMNIVCLGWGSLVWDPCCLPVSGLWNCDGPELPIEFARESKGKRITLVVANGAILAPVLWCNLCPDHITSIDRAKCALANREETSTSNIGFWSLDNQSSHRGAENVGQWARSHDIKAVVWTALCPGFKKDRNQKKYGVPEIGDIINHLRNLPEKEQKEAEKYVRKAPSQINTNYRALIEEEFGWTPEPSDKYVLQ